MESLWTETSVSQLFFHLTRGERSERHLGGTLLKGSTTVSAILQGIILCLSAHPDIQAKAHKEIDRVVGHDRLPDFQDLDKLEYIKAIIEEVKQLQHIVGMDMKSTLILLRYLVSSL